MFLSKNCLWLLINIFNNIIYRSFQLLQKQSVNHLFPVLLEKGQTLDDLNKSNNFWFVGKHWGFCFPRFNDNNIRDIIIKRVVARIIYWWTICFMYQFSYSFIFPHPKSIWIFSLHPTWIVYLIQLNCKNSQTI